MPQRCIEDSSLPVDLRPRQRKVPVGPVKLRVLRHLRQVEPEKDPDLVARVILRLVKLIGQVEDGGKCFVAGKPGSSLRMDPEAVFHGCPSYRAPSSSPNSG